MYSHEVHQIRENIYVRMSYSVPLSMRDKVEDELQWMLDNDIVERSNSPFCNLVRVVPKRIPGKNRGIIARCGRGEIYVDD